MTELDDSSVRFKLNNWNKVPHRQKKACFVLAGCVMFFIVSCVSSVLLLMNEFTRLNPSGPEGVPGLPQTAESIPEEYTSPAGLLEERINEDEHYLEETVFIGDSNTVRMLIYGLTPLENNMALEGIGIENVPFAPCVYFKDDPEVYTITQALVKVKPRRVIMTFGTNNATGEFTAEEFISAYEETIESIRCIYPYCDIIINSIPPVAKHRSYPQISQDTVDDFNDALEQMALEQELPFLNSAETLKDETGYMQSGYTIEDGLHMTRKALEAVIYYADTHPYVTQDRRPEDRKPAERKYAPGFYAVGDA